MLSPSPFHALPKRSLITSCVQQNCLRLRYCEDFLFTPISHYKNCAFFWGVHDPLLLIHAALSLHIILLSWKRVSSLPSVFRAHKYTTFKFTRTLTNTSTDTYETQMFFCSGGLRSQASSPSWPEDSLSSRR